MKNKMQNTIHGTLVLPILITSFILLFNCSKDSTVQPETAPAGYNENNDIAESIASDIGEDNGGLTDQIADLFAMTGSASLGKNSTSLVDSKESVYDSTSGSWTITVTRERGNPNGTNYAHIMRVYNVQFLNDAGLAQQFWLTDGDTASTIKFKIVEGEGRHKTLRLSQELKYLEGDFTATGTNTDIVTVNGTYKRAAVDTITTMRLTRIHDHSIDLTITDLKGPRGSRNDLSQKISGSITGTHNAHVTFISDNSYRERTITRDINIVIENGNANININKQVYSGDLGSGELN
ncbi:MAG TPA: hypothetical protein PLP19_08670 [bacterium]|nr:hypothetical protein [bacterium]HPN43546.1 hypothetical protein [bacterium]